MWQLYMILFISWGNASSGGPIIVDGFKTESACIAHAQKIIASTPRGLDVDLRFGKSTMSPRFLHQVCLKVEK